MNNLLNTDMPFLESNIQSSKKSEASTHNFILNSLNSPMSKPIYDNKKSFMQTKILVSKDRSCDEDEGPSTSRIAEAA